MEVATPWEDWERHMYRRMGLNGRVRRWLEVSEEEESSEDEDEGEDEVEESSEDEDEGEDKVEESEAGVNGENKELIGMEGEEELERRVKEELAEEMEEGEKRKVHDDNEREVKEEEELGEEELGEVNKGGEAEGGEVEEEEEQQIEEQLRQHEDMNQYQANDAHSAAGGDSKWTGFEDEEDTSECCSFEEMHDEERVVEKQDLDEELWRDESTILGESHDREDTESERKTKAEAESPDEEEESSDNEEEEEESVEEHVDSYDESVVKIYTKDDNPVLIFHKLTEFMDASLLTDLTLSAADGRSFQVHSTVLAAVSSVIREELSWRDNHRVHDETGLAVRRWSMSLDVDHDGLQAIVEFGYTGLVSRLNKNTVDRIKAAARTLGAPRVVDLCAKEEEETPRTGGVKTKEGISAAEQMSISLQSIKQLWMDGLGCDVTLEAVGASLHVHRVILAASSDYFRGMFSLGMRESYQHRVALPYLPASDLELLVGSSYSGTLPLSWSCAFEVTTTSLQLQYQPALSLCLNFLLKEINPHSCLDVASFAKAFKMVQLLEAAEDFILRKFQKVACTSKFKDLPAKQLLKYLKSSSLYVPSELVVFKAVVAWIQAKPKKRLKRAKELMRTIHFPLMTFKEFKEVQSLSMWSDHSVAELYEAIMEDFCSSQLVLQNHCRIYRTKESLVLVGGDQISEDLATRSISRELWFSNSLMNHTGLRKAMEWRRLGEMPEPARFNHEVAVFKEQLYMFGGKKYYGSDGLNSVNRYDPVQNSWERLADMEVRRSSFSVAVLDGNIYAIGGHCDTDYIESVERYSPAANSWSFACPLDLPLSGHVARDLQGQIFISGGTNSDYTCLSSMFLYHPETGSTYLANMTKPRAKHCMEALGDRLYVAGGFTTDDNMAVIDQLSCEMYVRATDSWTAFSSLSVPHVGAGSAVMEGKFYVLGGYSQDTYNETKLIHRYDPNICRWENIGRMPGPNNDIRAALLCLPPHVRL